MAEPVTDKDFLAERLEEDRQKMAAQLSELKEDYNVPHRLRASIQTYPWSWIMGAALTGFLLSRLPARRKEVYVSPAPVRSKPLREKRAPASDKEEPRAMNKLWSLAKPILSAYISRELYKRARRSDQPAVDRGRTGRAQRWRK
jgi:hypothetical protein